MFYSQQRMLKNRKWLGKINANNSLRINVKCEHRTIEERIKKNHMDLMVKEEKGDKVNVTSNFA